MTAGMRLWQVIEHTENHCYYIHDGEQTVVGRLSKAVAERICRCVNEHQSLVGKVARAERKITEREDTIAKLREYIRVGELNVIRSAKLGVKHK